MEEGEEKEEEKEDEEGEEEEGGRGRGNTSYKVAAHRNYEDDKHHNHRGRAEHKTVVERREVIAINQRNKQKQNEQS